MTSELRRTRWTFFFKQKDKRDFSLRRPSRSQEANVKEKASACFARNDGVGWLARKRGRAEARPCKAKKQIPSDKVGTFPTGPEPLVGRHARNDKLMR